VKLNGKAALITGGGAGMGRAITLKREAEGVDVANAIFYLACDTTGVTAQTTLVDGGMTALMPNT